MNWDIGMMPMKWRIAGKKLQYVRKLQLKEDENITKRALQQEVALGIIGLAHECLDKTNEIGLQNVSHGTHKKGLIKRTIAKKIKEQNGKQQKSQRQAYVQTRRQHIYQMPVLTTYKSVVQIQS